MSLHILLSNDDGFRAAGLQALYETLSTFAQVTVIAPEHNNSAKSNALTVTAPLYVHQASNGFHYVTGTPADCLHIALTGWLDFRPDLVVSGINNGANMGDDTLYSGTVGAAMEGYLFGIPAIAFSQVERHWRHLDAAAEIAAQLVQNIVQHPPSIPTPWLLNVNIPNRPKTEILGQQITRLGKRHAAESVLTQINPHGQTMYWIGPAGQAQDAGEGTDFYATQQGFVSMTPLQIDLTHHTQLPLWQNDWNNRSFGV